MGAIFDRKSSKMDKSRKNSARKNKMYTTYFQKVGIFFHNPTHPSPGQAQFWRELVQMTNSCLIRSLIMGAFFHRKSSKMDNMLVIAPVKTKCTLHTFKKREFSFIILLIHPLGRPNFGESSCK